jgi:L-asparagine permease
MVCHLLFVRQARAGLLARPSYRLPGTPFTQIGTLLFLGSVVVLMWLDKSAGRITLMALPAIIAALVLGWFGVRRRVTNIDREIPVAPDHSPEF